jgi:thioredoxin 2
VVRAVQDDGAALRACRGGNRAGGRLAKLDTEAAPQIAGRYGIRGIPTLIIFRKGAEIARQSGAMDYATLTRWIRGAI